MDKNTQTMIQNLYASEPFKALESVVETNDYHRNQTVSDHTRAVVTAIDDVLQFNYASGIEQDRLKAYFSEKVGDYTKAELLKIAAVVHDFGKPATYQEKLDKEGNKKTSCIKHGEKSAEFAESLLKAQGLSETEISYVKNVVSRHMDLITAYSQITKDKKNPEEVLAKQRKGLGELYLDVMAHTKADLMGCSPKPEDGIKFWTDALSQAMYIASKTGPVKDLENLTQVNTVYMKPESKQEVESQLTELYTAELESKIAAGKIPADKADGARAGVKAKVEKLSQVIQYGEAPSDAKTIARQKPVLYTLG